MKAVPAAGKTVTDYLIEGGKRLIEQFFRRRVRLRCDGEPTTLAYGARLKELLPECSGVGTNAAVRESSKSCRTLDQDTRRASQDAATGF